MNPETNRNYTYFALTQSWVFFLIGMVILFWLHTIGLEKRLLEQTPLAIEMDGKAGHDEIEAVKNWLLSTNSVKRNSIQLISKEEALRWMAQGSAEDSLLLTDENPFNPILLFQLKKESLQAEVIHQLKADVLQLSGVSHFSFQNELVNDISKTIWKIQSVSLGLAILFVVMSILIGKYLAGVFVDSKHQVIRTYARLGASGFQLKKPYLSQSAVLGLASAGFSICIIGIIWVSITYLVPWLKDWLQIKNFLLVVVFLLIFGPLIQIIFVNSKINRWMKE
jgi:cell division protein FtsX